MVAAILSVPASMVLTGCFHQDGLTDTADVIGGGTTRERGLEIRKDISLSSYGASVLFLNILLRIACLAALIEVLRWLAVVTMYGLGVLSHIESMKFYARSQLGVDISKFKD